MNTFAQDFEEEVEPQENQSSIFFHVTRANKLIAPHIKILRGLLRYLFTCYKLALILTKFTEMIIIQGKSGIIHRKT